MMKTIFTLIVALLATLSAAAQKLDGSWTGKLNVGQATLNIVFNIAKDKDNKLSCTMDSPDQNVKGIPAEIAVSEGAKVKISIPAIMAAFEGEEKDGMLKGTFSQSGMSFPLEMKQGKVERNRPQTPKEPYPYKTEEVTFSNTEDNATLSGTLTYPTGYEKMKKGTVPVVVMVTGSGLQDRNEEIFEHKPFLVIADFLARNGIASLRYDDRGMGKSKGDAANATTENFMKDALAAIEYVRGTKNFGKTGVLGHSEGGCIAFMAAAAGKADFIVSMAGTGVRGDSILMEQNLVLLKMSGYTDKMCSDYAKALRGVYDFIISKKTTGDAKATVDEIVGKAGISLPEPAKDNMAKIIEMNNPWLNYFIAFDPRPSIAKAKCPVMAINGNCDTQVIASTNIGSIEKLLPKNKKNMVKTYNGLNHLFQHCTTGSVNEYANIEETISPEVLNDIATWINSVK